MAFLRRHLETVIVATVVAAIVAGGPAIAHGVKHALFAHKAGVAANAKAFGGKKPGTFESQLSTATTKLESTMSHTTRAPGETATQTIKISNSGPGKATGVNLTSSGGMWTPSIPPTPGCTSQASGVSCTNLAVKKGATFTLVVTWTAACPPGGFVLPMIVSATGWKYDTTPSNNTTSHNLTTTGCPTP